MTPWDIGPCILIFDPIGEYAGLSNYADSIIEAVGTVWPSAEHLFQAQKFLSAAHREQIRAASTPAAAKSIAWNELNSHVRHDWDSIRVDAMTYVLRKKFRQNNDKGRLLCSSFPLPIAEDSMLDAYWGIGPGQGQNHLGNIMERIRAELLEIPEMPVKVTLPLPEIRSIQSRLAAVRGGYRITPLLRALPNEHLGSSTITISIDDLIRASMGGQLRNNSLAESGCRGKDVAQDDLPEEDTFKALLGANVTRFRNRSQLFEKALANAFDSKYADYCWREDARSYISDWPQRFLNLLNSMTVAKRGHKPKGLIIGAGAGEEAAYIWAQFLGDLTLVDIGPRMVLNCRRQLDRSVSICARAEDLSMLPDGAYDFYCALRVYQSIYFDLETAIEEAIRILRYGGLFIISVSDAYLAADGKLERGQIVGNSIDYTRALNMACRVTDYLSKRGFSGIGFSDLTTELVVYARKADPKKTRTPTDLTD